MHVPAAVATGRPGRLLRIRNIAAVIVALDASSHAGAVTLAATADVLSDYRFRGVSLSDRHPVVDASVEASAGGWFAGVAAISATLGRSPYRTARRDAEIDASAGWSRSFGLLTPTVGAIAYVHPGSGEADGEGFATLAGSLGPATVTVGVNYAPGQAAARGGNLYLFTRAAAGLPGTPLTFRAGLGRERGAFAGGATKIDWSGGVEARVRRVVTLGIDYVGNDLPRGTGRLAHNRDDGVAVRAGVRF